ncbi:MAG: hypothetical protein ACFFF9_04490 [Candidatus Thorarchaeota archaeon]
MRRERKLRVLIALFLLVTSIISIRLLPVSSFESGQGIAITGTNSGGTLGMHFVSIGDVNGDSIDDFLVGELLNHEGRVYLFHGRPDSSWEEMTVEDADASFVGEGYNNWFGRWTAGLGDIDGNGYADFAISAIRNNNAASQAGKVYIFLGGSNTIWGLDTPATQSNISITGEAVWDNIGHGVYGIGDTNGDNYDDFIVSSFSDEGGLDSGQLYLFYGRPQGQWLDTYSAAEANASWIGNPGDYVSMDASGIGDVNNDGYTDFAIGAWTNQTSVSHRSVYLILGGAGTNWTMDQPISLSNASLIGRNNTGLGLDFWSLNWVSGAGDVNGDSFDDILVGAYDEDDGGSNSGTTYLFLGRSTESWTHNITFSNANASFVGESANDWSGSSVGGAGDVNGDSFDDFVIGAPSPFDITVAQGRGRAYLILGGPSQSLEMDTPLANADFIYEPEQVNAAYGMHVQGIGDVNDDGLDDFAIGAPYFDTDQTNVGKTYIILHYDQPSTWPTTSTTAPPPFDITLVLMVAVPVVLVVLIGIAYFGKRR